MEARYRGWIPTVTGRLSFSHFGDLHGTRSVRRSDSKKRYLIAYQNRKTGDSPIPSFIQHLLGVGSRAHFICVAQTADLTTSNGKRDPQGELTGTIFIIDQSQRWKKLKATSVKTCFSSLADYDQNSSATIEQHFSQSHAALIEQCAAQCSFQADFRLARNGVADFYVRDDMRTREGAPQYDGAALSRLRFSLSHQAYSFLKDLGHHHKHHSKRNDTITDLYEFDGSDDRDWRRKTLFGIYRRIITAMRRDDIMQQISSAGLLAYAKTFKEIWLEAHPKDEEEKEIPIFYDVPMRESIQASEVKMRFFNQQKADQHSTFRTILFSGVGLVLSIAGLVRISDNTHIKEAAAGYLIALATLLVKYPLQILAPLFAIFYFWLVAWPRYLKPQRSRVLKLLQSLLQPFGRHWSIALFWIVGTILFVLGMKLVFGH